MANSLPPARRSPFRQALGAGAVAACLAGVSGVSAQDADRRPPDIVVILSDDMGYSDIGCYGGEIETPVLDGLAANGLRFTQFYNTARCCPTRASLLTGLYPHQAGMGHMTGNRDLEGYQGNLNRNSVTLAEVLRPAGYGTYMVGKWHVARSAQPDGDKGTWPLQRGFDRYYGTIQGAGSFFDPHTLTRDNTPISAYADPEYAPRGTFYYTDAISDHGARFIREHCQTAPQRPLFLYAAYTCAHWPMHALPEEMEKYRGRYAGGYGAIREARHARMKTLGLVRDGWPLTPQAEEWSEDPAYRAWEERCMEVYAAMIDRMDQGIGRLVAELERQGRLHNTLLFFLQDNGGCAESFGRGGNFRPRPDAPTFDPMPAAEIQTRMVPRQTRDGYPVRQGRLVMPGPADTSVGYGRGWANVSNTPFREYKHWVHEGGISTPLVVHWPAGIPSKGTFVHEPGHLVDIMATSVAVSGARYPSTVDGRAIRPMEGVDLRPLFAGRPIQRQAIYWEHEGNRAVRVGKWKLVAKGHNGPWELYDMEADRTELDNLATAQPAKTAELASLWDAWALRAHAKPWPWGQIQPDNVGSNQARFVLKAGEKLVREACPRVGGTPFRVSAEVEIAGDGVILAQGGSSLGYALYVRNGLLEAAVRRKDEGTFLTAPGPLPPGRQNVGMALLRGGRLEISAGGQVVATAEAGGLIQSMPLDGLLVGGDDGGLVGRYGKDGNAFAGTIHEVCVELEKAPK
ncbi:MAG: arylsulfatase [Lentisphaeria bacterium]|nr:arylsulfatase [Lentisphaeria bacterium]